MGYYDRGWPEYVPVAERKKKAQKHIESLKKKGVLLKPVIIEGRKITKTFWGKAWCDNLEAYSDLYNRLERGRTYVRNGSVIDLQITAGQIKAQVMGSSLYKVNIEIKPLAEEKWQKLVKACAGKIDSLIELLQGKFSKGVMEILTEKEEGLFPKPQEIKMKCSCPDYAGLCKHIAAVLYGIGAALDEKPEWLFELRHVDQLDLLATASKSDTLTASQTNLHSIEDEDLSNLFGIEMAATPAPAPVKAVPIKKAKVQPTKNKKTATTKSTKKSKAPSTAPKKKKASTITIAVEIDAPIKAKRGRKKVLPKI